MKLHAEAVNSILYGVTIGTAERAKAYDSMMAKADERIHQQVEETAVQGHVTHTPVKLHVMDWVAAQKEDPILKIVMEWISSDKTQVLRHFGGDHIMKEKGMSILRKRKNFMLHHGLLYHCHTLAEEL